MPTATRGQVKAHGRRTTQGRRRPGERQGRSSSSDGESILQAVKNARTRHHDPRDARHVPRDRLHRQGQYPDRRRDRGGSPRGARRAEEAQRRDPLLGNNFVVENLEIRNYKGNGVMGQAGNNFEIRNNVIVDTGVYGSFRSSARTASSRTTWFRASPTPRSTSA